MQEETPAPTKKSRAKKKKRMKQTPSKMKGTMSNNPYQNVPVKTNNPPNTGFNFPGASM